jgi:hypothetical protein
LIFFFSVMQIRREGDIVLGRADFGGGDDLREHYNGKTTPVGALSQSAILRMARRSRRSLALARCAIFHHQEHACSPLNPLTRVLR